MKRWLISVAAAVAIAAGSTLAAGPAMAAAPSSASSHQAAASTHQATTVAAKDFCSGHGGKKKRSPSRPFNNLDWLRFGYLLVAAPSKESDLCPILA
ncbi:hypothetical protein [Arthrobacter ginkgonis]